MSTATLAVRRNQNLYRTKTDMKLGPVSATVVVVAAISVLALLYLTQVTKVGVLGYQVSDLQRQRAEAVSNKQELEVEAARLTSIQSIQKSGTVQKMVASSQVSYAK